MRGRWELCWWWWLIRTIPEGRKYLFEEKEIMLFTNHDGNVYFVVDSCHIELDFDCILAVVVVDHHRDIVVEIDLIDP